MRVSKWLEFRHGKHLLRGTSGLWTCVQMKVSKRARTLCASNLAMATGQEVVCDTCANLSQCHHLPSPVCRCTHTPGQSSTCAGKSDARGRKCKKDIQSMIMAVEIVRVCQAERHLSVYGCPSLIRRNRIQCFSLLF